MNMLANLLRKKNARLRKPYGFALPAPAADAYARVEIIMDEWQAYVARTRDTGYQIDELSAEQKELNSDKKWKAFPLFLFGTYNPEASLYFPETLRSLQLWENEITMAFFSNLEPGKHIPPHTGNNHCVIRTQIGIDIPQPNQTGLRVADKTVRLENGEFFTFDDTYEHEAWNYGERVRTVLIIDSRKKFPFGYDWINRAELKKMRQTDYVQSVMKKLNKET